MRRLSQRTDGLARSDIRAITDLIDRHDGINLGQGICDMPVPAPIKDAAKAAIEEDRSIYSNYAGIESLRTAILEKARRYNHLPAAGKEEVLVTAGSTGAFVAAIFTLLDPGDEVILFEPFYGYHRNLIGLIPATLRYARLHGPDWRVDFDEVRRLISPRTKAVVLCTPGNPSGKVWTRDELQALQVLLEAHDLYAITDEIYEYMLYDGREHLSLASLPGAYARTITISGFSKTYNMTGWRLGYAIAAAPLAEKMGLLNDLFYICAPTPLQHGVRAAFGLEEGYYTGILQTYAEKRRMLCEALEAIGMDPAWPQGAYYVMADFERFARGRAGFSDAAEACETLVREAGVASIPGTAFYADPAAGRHQLRFCFAKELFILQEACHRLTAAYG